MTYFVLASVLSAPVAPPSPASDQRKFWLESWDGKVTVPITTSPMWRGPLDGSTGLDVAPTQVLTAVQPGVAGSMVTDVLTVERPVVLALDLRTTSKADQDEQLGVLRDLVAPTTGMTRDGSFRLVCSGPAGVRQLGLVYQSGLEGDGKETPTFRRVVLNCVAPQPFAEDRTDQQVPFRIAPTALTGIGGIWGEAGVSTSSVLSQDTPVEMWSAVPVYPTLTLTGPAASILIEGDNGMRVDVPTGLSSGDTLVIVTDPRRKSIRLNGAPAAGKLARGSRTPAFNLGTTLISVNALSATNATILTLGWRGLHRSLS
ncbi:hypothetical protein Xcel_0521 [Xylanimonas cellulosilytica DSM 15894]|uniref:Siphovirus-type tail component C-terminal domain-containing protein n=1 Tax=Xylanimonas cellulosilytica (strain DSM 15894 / JCM 12276 / CECT 5975 / KCTC 9989 / LMG 20990 / NBRC 107835 / XIL07) TaxID=446471 RepID=D1BW57_XYLCX|nr:hypothetical protein [Xylanimonas cellulosilytica]ACZ29560.1 hypothetical protein Xcel_0521 [Xylanimonas cellulosilytica DSM 15894]